MQLATDAVKLFFKEDATRLWLIASFTIWLYADRHPGDSYSSRHPVGRAILG